MLYNPLYEQNELKYPTYSHATKSVNWLPLLIKSPTGAISPPRMAPHTHTCAQWPVHLFT